MDGLLAGGRSGGVDRHRRENFVVSEVKAESAAVGGASQSGVEVGVHSWAEVAWS